MAVTDGIPVTGPIITTDPSDTYPTIDLLYALDGLRNVATYGERNSISDDRRREGMIVGVTADGTYWRLLAGPWAGTTADWQAFGAGASGGVGGTGTTNAIMRWTNGPLSQAGDSIMHQGPSAIQIREGFAYYTATGGSYSDFNIGVSGASGNVLVTKDWVNFGGGNLPFYFVPVGATVLIPDGKQMLIYGDLNVEGNITNYGQLVILNGNLGLSGGTFDNYGTFLLQTLQTGVETKFSSTFGATAGVPVTITHNMGTLDFVYSIREGFNDVSALLTRVDINTVEIVTSINVSSAKISMIAV